MPPLPTTADLTDVSRNRAAVQAAHAALRSYLATLFGEDGTPGTALATLGAMLSRVQPLAVATNLGATDRGKFIEASGTWSLRLPSVASVGAGWSIVVRNVGTGVITITRVSPDTIDGATTLTLQPRQTVLFVSGTEWETIVLGGAVAGQTRLSSGSLATPALALGGQSTGLFSPATDQVGLSVLGVLRVLLSSTAAQINVPVTGTAVTQSATDATAGRLLRVGDFGLGGNAPALPGDDCNGTFPNGVYGISSTTLNQPGTAGSGVLHAITRSTSISASPSQFHILLKNRALDGVSMWVRNVSGSVYGAWQEVFNQSGILGVVSQNAGQPTGALIEVGENANGAFRRFACGLQICWSTNRAFTNANTSAGVLFASAPVSWTYPAAFAAAPVVQGCADDTDAILSGGVPGLSSVSLRVLSAITKATAINARATAVGRWF